MTAHSPTNALAHFCVAIANAAPREWEAFCECFDAYATDVTVAVTAADQSEVLVAQGRARAFLHLLKVFRDPRGHLHVATPPPPQPTQQP